jgi:AcrR family transcriptional regulator
LRGDCLDSFFSLRAEKQEHIINAALTVFGRNGYKKASIADIAGEAGIAKGMVMYYFGSKKNLYFYLAGLCRKLVLEEIGNGVNPDVTDYFDKIKMMTDMKVAMMKWHPAIFSFLASLYYETDREVAGELKGFMAENMLSRERIVLEGNDTSKFKDDVEPKLLDKFFTWASEGMANDLLMNRTMEMVDGFVAEFYALLELMKKYLYKT